MLTEPIAPHTPGDDLRKLSHRETEVLAMASTGLTNAQIAQQLKVTVHAVKFHLASIYKKLGVCNRTEAAVFYLTEQASMAETSAVGGSGA